MAEDLGAEELDRLRIAVGRLERRLRTASAGDLTPSQLSALVTVVDHGPLPLSELARREAVNPTSLSRIVGHLEENGLITRQVRTEDRRSAEAAATPTGRERAAAVRQARAAALAARVERLEPELRSTLREALGALEALASEDESTKWQQQSQPDQKQSPTGEREPSQH